MEMVCTSQMFDTINRITRMLPLGVISSHLRAEQVGVQSKELKQKRHGDFSPRNNNNFNARSETILHFHYADNNSQVVFRQKRREL